MDAGPAGCAVIEVLVRADAELSFFGQKTERQGAVRRFVTPPLVPGRSYYYDLQARWHENGREIALARSVVIHADERQTVDFLAADVAPTAVSK
jgi:uncharacterized protein (TIGR03000 family)